MRPLNLPSLLILSILTLSMGGCLFDPDAIKPPAPRRQPSKFCFAQGSTNTCVDNNKTDGDGCSSTCLAEEGWRCEMGHCSPICGDGKRLGEEQCDLGHLGGTTPDWDENKTGCSHECSFKKGWSMCGHPDTGTQKPTWQEQNSCTRPVCGDGIVAVGLEECDDGNTTSTVDGCDSKCHITQGFQCSNFDGIPETLYIPITYRMFDSEKMEDLLGRVSICEPGTKKKTCQYNLDLPVTAPLSGKNGAYDTRYKRRQEAFSSLFDGSRDSLPKNQQNSSDPFSIAPLVTYTEPYIFKLEAGARSILDDTFSLKENLLNTQKPSTQKGFVSIPSKPSSDRSSSDPPTPADNAPTLDPFGSRCLPAFYSGTKENNQKFKKSEQHYTATIHIKFYYHTEQELAFGADAASSLFVYLNHRYVLYLPKAETPGAQLSSGTVKLPAPDSKEAKKLGLVKGQIYDLDIFFIHTGTNDNDVAKLHLSIPGVIIGPSYCYKCGDGIPTIGEECDDGNQKDGDGCSSTCKVEAQEGCALGYDGRSYCGPGLQACKKQ